MGPFRGLLELYLGGPMIEQRMVAVTCNAEGISLFNEQTLGRGSLVFEAILALDILVLKLLGMTLDLKKL